MHDDFLGGVVEGFYGRPWTPAERLRLFEQMERWRLNTYFYAPKDDLKHRALWRQCYDDAELASLTTLIDACSRRGIRFIYGLSPGLDIRFADPSEQDAIRERLSQLLSVGAHHFALLFDDLSGDMQNDDHTAFENVAAAQCSVTNAVFSWLRQQSPASRFLFCPTPYCGRMDHARLGGPDYLETVGQQLDSAIDVLWTGPEIVSAEISAESVRALTARIGRPPVIWDNLFANDYDFRRLYCGPYAGRPPELKGLVRGILANPNNEFPINFVPLRTLAEFLHCTGDWEPRRAFLSAADEWHASFQTVGQPITREDLVLLADCYYLPHEDGPTATQLFGTIARLATDPVSSWHDAKTRFTEYNERIQALFEQLTELRDRELFYAWSRRAWELKEELDLIADLARQKENGHDLSKGIAVDSHLPQTYRGGLVARIQRLWTMDEEGRFHAEQ